jgi:hypothetical protein
MDSFCWQRLFADEIYVVWIITEITYLVQNKRLFFKPVKPTFNYFFLCPKYDIDMTYLRL